MRRDDDAGLSEALTVLADDGVVVVPTETVYGLAGRALSERAIAAIYAAKGRPSDNPLILHVGAVDDAWPLWRFHDAHEAQRAELLARLFWPGPLTIVALTSDAVPPTARAGLPKVAVRAPAHAFARRLALALGEPFAAPSANASGRPSPTTAQDVVATLSGRVPLVIDGGRAARGIESSVVDVTGARPRLLRPGALSVLELRRALPDIDVRAPGVMAHSDDASPGLRHRHYAPIGGARLVTAAGLDEVWADEGCCVVVRNGDLVDRARRVGPTVILPDDVDGYARELFAALYRAERIAAPALVIADVPADEAWIGVRDRLLRATA